MEECFFKVIIVEYQKYIYIKWLQLHLKGFKYFQYYQVKQGIQQFQYELFDHNSTF